MFIIRSPRSANVSDVKIMLTILKNSFLKRCDRLHGLFHCKQSKGLIRQEVERCHSDVASLFHFLNDRFKSRMMTKEGDKTESLFLMLDDRHLAARFEMSF